MTSGAVTTQAARALAPSREKALPGGPVIQVRELSKRYHIFDKPHHRVIQTLFRKRCSHEFQALDRVTFEVNRGETVGIIGRNGSGKSTLLQIVSGTLTPTSGDVKVQGRLAALLELGAGFNPEFTGIENVHVNAALMGLTRAQIRERLDRILAFADIGDFVHQPVKTYSSGMFVRLAFSIIANVDADVLVIDEALAVGDAFFTQKCMRFLRAFKEHGTILFVSHDSSAVVNLCERAIWIDNGVVRGIGDAKTVSELYLRGSYEREQGLPDAAAIEPARMGVDAREAVAPDDVIGALDEIVANEKAEVDTAFGKLGAVLGRVRLVGIDGRDVVAIQGGEDVTLVIEAEARTDITNPLAGFHVKDRLGQLLFGDNTCQRRAETTTFVPRGRLFRAEFEFQMPHLKAGEYTISAAVGEGTQEDHVIHHWVHDVLAFRSQSRVLHGLVGIAARKVLL